eukprot:scaffold27541_cov56-Phaeocystis_antarctica.AAC.4
MPAALHLRHAPPCRRRRCAALPHARSPCSAPLLALTCAWMLCSQATSLTNQTDAHNSWGAHNSWCHARSYEHAPPVLLVRLLPLRPSRLDRARAHRHAVHLQRDERVGPAPAGDARLP